MTSLPPALRPWAAQLSLFPEEMALSLGPHVARLSAALGALRPRGESSGGEPMGYDGLARRGTYERLLLTEWLYAEEAPEEFIRRAAFGEHSFLRPTFRQPQGARRSVALLDAGPEQLGTPRLAHLALLVVLARRAEAAGAAFEWGVLQRPPEGGTFSGLTVAGVNAWLAARSAMPVTGEHVAAWREALKPGGAPEDCWLVGPARLGRLAEASGLSRVEVEEGMEPGVRRLSVRVWHAARAPREVALELPPADTCVRLLRDPFSSRTQAPVRLAGTGKVRALRFSSEGTRLLMFRSDGGVTVQAVPASPRHTMPRPRYIDMPLGHEVVAVDWRPHGGFIALTQHEEVLQLAWGTLSGPRAYRSPRFPVEQYRGVLPRPPSNEEAPGQVLGLRGYGRERLLVRDGAGGLFLLAPPEREGRAAIVVEEKVLAFAQVRRRPVWAFMATGTQTGYEVWLGIWESGQLRHIPLGEGDGEVFLGHAESIGHPEAGLLAVRQRPGLWRVLLRQGHVELEPPKGSRVVGVGVMPYPVEEPALLVLGEDRRTFSLLGTSETRTLIRASDDVEQVVVSHGLSAFAWLTVKGEVVVWSFKYSASLYRSMPPEAP